MERDYVYPDVANRQSPKEWNESNRPAILKAASHKMREILTSHFPSHISEDIDREIRANYPVRLPRSHMLRDG